MCCFLLRKLYFFLRRLPVKTAKHNEKKSSLFLIEFSREFEQKLAGFFCVVFPLVEGEPPREKKGLFRYAEHGRNGVAGFGQGYFKAGGSLAGLHLAIAQQVGAADALLEVRVALGQ